MEVGKMEPMKELETCGICEEKKEHGIHLYTMFICQECEYNMIHTEPREEKYRYYVKKLKNVNQQQLFS
jgi:hypothetical protein